MEQDPEWDGNEGNHYTTLKDSKATKAVVVEKSKAPYSSYLEVKYVVNGKLLHC